MYILLSHFKICLNFLKFILSCPACLKNCFDNKTTKRSMARALNTLDRQ